MFRLARRRMPRVLVLILAAAVLAVYTLVFIALAYWRFRRRDITTG